MRCPRCKNAFLVCRTRLWKLKTCSNECFSKSLRESVLDTRVNKYSSCSVSVGFAKGPRRTTARISADRLLCQGHRDPMIREQSRRRHAQANTQCSSGPCARDRNHALHQSTFSVVTDGSQFSGLSSPPRGAVWNVRGHNCTKPFRKGIGRISRGSAKLSATSLCEEQCVFNCQIQLEKAPHVRSPEPLLDRQCT